jgi:hypothetical protein
MKGMSILQNTRKKDVLGKFKFKVDERMVGLED